MKNSSASLLCLESIQFLAADSYVATSLNDGIREGESLSPTALSQSLTWLNPGQVRQYLYLVTSKESAPIKEAVGDIPIEKKEIWKAVIVT